MFGDDVFAPWAGRWPVVQSVDFGEVGLRDPSRRAIKVIWTVGGRLVVRVIGT